jgi:hypothetical protein
MQCCFQGSFNTHSTHIQLCAMPFRNQNYQCSFEHAWQAAHILIGVYTRHVRVQSIVGTSKLRSLRRVVATAKCSEGLDSARYVFGGEDTVVQNLAHPLSDPYGESTTMQTWGSLHVGMGHFRLSKVHSRFSSRREIPGKLGMGYAPAFSSDIGSNGVHGMLIMAFRR